MSIYKLTNFEFKEYEYGYHIITTPSDWHVEGEKIVARLHLDNNRLHYSHGYFPPHPIGNVIEKWAKKNKIKTNSR